MTYKYGYYENPFGEESRGFTLVELMVTIAIAAVLMTLALPSFRELLINSNVTQTMNKLVYDLNLARAEAVRRGTQVAVVSAAGGWSAGWQVNVLPAATTVLDVEPAVPVNYTVKTFVTNGVGGTGTAASVVFNAQGNLANGVTEFDINVCRPDSAPTKSKAIFIKGSGVATSQTGMAGTTAPSC